MSFSLLLISIAALGIGPLIARAWSSHGGVRRGLDGFVTIGVGGLVLTHILPPSIQAGGLAAWLLLVAGMILPTAIERVQHGHVHTAHAAALVLAFLALSLHAMSDGVVLSLADGGSGWAFSTALAVVLHRIPVGIAVWVFLRSAKGLKWVLWVFALIAINTVIGFMSGTWVIALMQDSSFAWFQAFVAGSLLHVIFHAHEHDHAHDHGDPFGHGHDHVHASAPEEASTAPSALSHAADHAHADHVHADHTLHEIHDDASHAHDEHPTHPTPHRHAHGNDAAASKTYAALRCVPEPWEATDRSAWVRALRFVDVRAVVHQIPELIGAAIGVALVLFLSWMEDYSEHAHVGHTHGMGSFALKFSDLSVHSEHAIERWMHLALESSGWLLMGYLLSAVFFFAMRQPGIPWLNGGGNTGSVLRGSVMGAVMPVRACGVVPVFGALVDRGARWGGATSFLYATPQLRLETLFFSVPLLGAPLMGIRVASMVCISLVVGWIASRLQPVSSVPVDASRPPAIGAASAVHQALFRLVDDTAPWVMFGLAVAALIPQNGFEWFAAMGSAWTMIFLILLAIPLYLCATGATPVAAALLFAGVSPGAALVFLLAGPVTVLNSFRAIRARAGRGTAWAIVVMGWFAVLGAGMLTDAFFDPSGEYVATLHNDAAGTPWQWAAFSALMGLFLWSLFRNGPRSWLSTIVAGDHG